MAIALTIQGKVTYHDDSEADEVMRRYFQAHTGGDATASIRQVERPKEDDVTTAPGTVSEVARGRIKQQEDDLVKAGFAVRAPIYAPGMRVLPLGDDNFRLERERVEALPAFEDAAKRVQEVVERENREDIEMHTDDLKMEEDGTLLVDGTSMLIEREAFVQLAMLGGFGGGEIGRAHV